MQHFFSMYADFSPQDTDWTATTRTWRLKCWTLVFYVNFRRYFYSENFKILLTAKQLAATT